MFGFGFRLGACREFGGGAKPDEFYFFFHKGKIGFSGGASIYFVFAKCAHFANKRSSMGKGNLLGFVCELELASLIEQRAREAGKSVSEYIRDILLKDLEERIPEESE